MMTSLCVRVNFLFTANAISHLKLCAFALPWTRFCVQETSIEIGAHISEELTVVIHRVLQTSLEISVLLFEVICSVFVVAGKMQMEGVKSEVTEQQIVMKEMKWITKWRMRVMVDMNTTWNAMRIHKQEGRKGKKA